MEAEEGSGVIDMIDSKHPNSYFYTYENKV